MIAYVLAALAGAVSVAAYAPLEWWWLMPLCIAMIFHLIHSKPSKPAFILAFLFGLGQFGVGASWVYVSLQTYGNMPVWMAGIAVLFFVAVYALLTGFVGYLYACFKLNASVFRNAVFFAALWVLAEWGRSLLFTGFPWLDVGYSQTTQWLSGYAPVGSVYLVSFVCVLSSVLLLVVAIKALSYCLDNVDQPRIGLPRLSLAVALLVSILAGGAILQTVQWSQATGKTYQVALIQANVPIETKWEPQFQTKVLSDYVEQIQAYAVDLVVLPETALPVYMHQTDENFWQQLKGENHAILAGIVERDFDTRQIFNSANLVCGQAEAGSATAKGTIYPGEQVYRKQHLVPFGEYLPLRSLLNWILAYLQIPMSDFTAGDAGQSLECDGLQIGLSICYEDAFASGMRYSLPKNSQQGVLINISEDAWFGDSLAPHQRVQMAQMRALELARPMLRSANSGPSTHIDYQGQVLASTGQFVVDSLVVEVQPRTGDTPFVRLGLWIVWLCVGITLAMMLVSAKQTRSRQH